MREFNFWMVGICLLCTCMSTSAEVRRDVDYVTGIAYADDKDKLDVHMPQDAKDAPLVVYFHGGALMFGNKQDGDGVARRLTELGIGVVSANYRLSPAVQHPAHVRDAAAAFAWVVRHAQSLGADSRRIYVAGHSAGGYLAALLALDGAHLAEHGLDLSAIAGAIPISPFLYVEETARDRPKTVWGDDPDNWLAASVTPHIGAGKPPMLLLYADGDDDWRKAQNERLAAALREVGNATVRVQELPDRDHRSLITRVNQADDRIGSEIVDFIRRVESAE